MKQYKFNIIVGKSRATRTCCANNEKEVTNYILNRYGIETTILWIKKCGGIK